MQRIITFLRLIFQYPQLDLALICPPLEEFDKMWNRFFCGMFVFCVTIVALTLKTFFSLKSTAAACASRKTYFCTSFSMYQTTVSVTWHHCWKVPVCLSKQYCLGIPSFPCQKKHGCMDYITPSESCFMLSETHCGVVDCLVSSLWVDKATGVDGISARLLIEACPQIVPSLTHIINLSVRGGYFPDKWKISKVSLLYKEDIKSDPNNFWPISILLVVSKIIEKVIFKQLYEYLTHNNCWT